MKQSSAKATLPGRKQVFRRYASGQPVQGLESLDAIAARTAASVASLPAPVRQISAPADYPVTQSEALIDLAARTRRAVPQPQN